MGGGGVVKRKVDTVGEGAALGARVLLVVVADVGVTTGRFPIVVCTPWSGCSMFEEGEGAAGAVASMWTKAVGRGGGDGVVCAHGDERVLSC